MAEPFLFEQYTIMPVDAELEVNYIISDFSGYICRLVPGEAGFEVSKADKALGIEIPLKFVAEISDHIVRQDA